MTNELTLDKNEPTVDQLVLTLGIEKIIGIYGPKTENIDLALHQEFSSAIILWGKGLETFLRGYLPVFPPLDTRIEDDYLNEIMEDVVFDEKTFPLTRFIMRKSLEGQVVTLSRLAQQVFKGQTQNSFRFRRKLRDNIVWPMEQLGLWKVVKIMGEQRSLKNGIDKESRIKEYEISAGPTLWDFHKFVYIPWRRRQIMKTAELLARDEEKT